MRCFVYAVAVAVLAAAVPGAAQTARKAPSASRLALVQAQCFGQPPGPCAPDFTFATGIAILTPSKQPAPTCPGGKSPRGGQVRLTGVQRSGSPFTGTLKASVTLKTTIATDTHNGNCELSGVQIALPGLTGDVACRNGKCKGDLVGAGCLPGSCADTVLTTELVSLVVTTEAGDKVATPGTFVPPARADTQ
jgi:hypothetical protein